MAVSLHSSGWHAGTSASFGLYRAISVFQVEMKMQVALMVPYYIDMFYPHVGIATLELLEKLGVDVVYPQEQTCCGQPMANSGCYEEARATEEHEEVRS
jgi:Fe-S oxidoreductase